MSSRASHLRLVDVEEAGDGRHEVPDEPVRIVNQHGRGFTLQYPDRLTSHEEDCLADVILYAHDRGWRVSAQTFISGYVYLGFVRA